MTAHPHVTSPAHSEDIELQGHIIDSLLLPKVLDEILTHGGSYVLKDIRVGQRQTDPSFARVADSARILASMRSRVATTYSRADAHEAESVSTRPMVSVTFWIHMSCMGSETGTPCTPTLAMVPPGRTRDAAVSRVSG